MAIGPAGHELSFYDEISVEELMEFPFIPPEEIVRHQNLDISALYRTGNRCQHYDDTQVDF